MSQPAPQHPFLTHDKFLLATFSSNCSGGMTVSKLPDRWQATMENNIKLAKLLDDAGIDFMLPIAAGSATAARPTFTARCWRP